jgi:hypothetical protein
MNEAATPSSVPVEASQRRALRKLYLTLFLRGRSARSLKRTKAPVSVGRKLWSTLLFYGAYGMFALYFGGQDVTMLSAYCHGLTFLFVGMFIASSAGEVLFNRVEPDILLHRPVSAKALLWAKISVMMQVAMWIAFALNLAGFVVGYRMPDGGWMYPLIHLVSTFLEIFFCAGFIVMTYQLSLRWLGRERLDGLMTTAQVLFMVLLIAGSQILPRVLTGMNRAGLTELDAPWLALLPPMWFAGLDAVGLGNRTPFFWMSAGLSVGITGVVWILAFGKLAADYEAGLQKLGESLPHAPETLRRRWTQRLLQIPLLRWWLRDPVTRASFLLCSAYMCRDREVKLRLYPGIAPVVMMPVVFLLQKQGIGDGGSGFGLAFSGCYLALASMLAQNILQYSQQWAAADLFRAAPLTGPGSLCHGARKATLLFLTLPMLFLVAGLALALGVPLAQLVLFLPGLLLTPLVSLAPGLMGKDVPLSQPAEDAKAANRGLGMILMILVAVALAVVVNFAWSAGVFWWLILGEAVVVAAGYAWGRWRLNRLRWEDSE